MFYLGNHFNSLSQCLLQLGRAVPFPRKGLGPSSTPSDKDKGCHKGCLCVLTLHRGLLYPSWGPEWSWPLGCTALQLLPPPTDPIYTSQDHGSTVVESVQNISYTSEGSGHLAGSAGEACNLISAS